MDKKAELMACVTTATAPCVYDNCIPSAAGRAVCRFWLMDCASVSECGRLTAELYRDVTAVPFVSQVVVFAKRRSMIEAHLRVYCVTDDRLDKTLETREHYREVARSRGIEARNFIVRMLYLNAY